MKAGPLSEKSSHLAKQYGINADVVINHYFFDALLLRLSKSQFCDEFILKGGYLLSIDMGVVSRTTRDLDFSYQKDVDQVNLKVIFMQIININVGDEIQFELLEIESGQELVHVRLLASLEQIKHYMHVDVSLKDLNYPFTDFTEHQMILTNNKIKLRKLPIYYYISEKLHIISKFGIYNGRAKDYYDLYALTKKGNQVILLNKLHEALSNTFKHRNDILSYKELKKELNLINNDSNQKQQWILFTKKHHFAKELDFDEVISMIFVLVEQLENEHSK